MTLIFLNRSIYGLLHDGQLCCYENRNLVLNSNIISIKWKTVSLEQESLLHLKRVIECDVALVRCRIDGIDSVPLHKLVQRAEF